MGSIFDPGASVNLETTLNLAAQHAFEIISLLIAAAALVYAALAFKAAKHAVQATKDSDLTALRVKMQDSISGAERSLIRLQEACQATRLQWENKNDRAFPVLGTGFFDRSETDHIQELEHAGFKLLQELAATAPKATSSTTEIEAFIGRARTASVQIERLKFRLECPKSAWR
ncbi:hypothetical protein [Yoonia litorea]|uniref:Uncharacterized protein n=1 Tax=Yoonia litorea TaxID=1123755 RepID=A0A1I6N2R1_9RHOB|nr:hypothetical protein [Yoonia litorea]SFS22265.1 hypothetical protein SAMN05444714_3229 [Yoonia litorea]